MSDGRAPIPSGRLKVYRVLVLGYSVVAAVLFGYSLTRTDRAAAETVWWLLTGGAVLSLVVAVWAAYELASDKSG